MAIGLILASCFSLGGVFWLGQYQSDYLHRQEEARTRRETHPDTECYSIFGFAPLCIKGESYASAETERAEDDLQAQQDMAEWAKWITLATALQVVVGIAGTVMLIGNLRQGQIQAHAAQRAVASNARANIIAKDAYAANERPWVRIKFEAITLVDLKFNRGNATIEVENVGKTPALDVRVRLFPLVIRRTQPDKEQLSKLVERTLSKAPLNTMTAVVAFPNDPFPLRANEDYFHELDPSNQYDKGKVVVGMFAVCTYRSNLSRTFWHSAVGVKVIHIKNGGESSSQTFDMDGDPVGVDGLTFKPDNRLTSIS